MGNATTNAKLGKISEEAMQGIELKCGGSSIKMDPASITTKSVMVKTEGSAMAELKDGGSLGDMVLAEPQVLGVTGFRDKAGNALATASGSFTTGSGGGGGDGDGSDLVSHRRPA